MSAMAKKKRQTAFGKRLRALREESGLTQTELGERVGMTYQHIAKYERGAIEPSWGVVIEIADALGVSPAAFLDPPPES